MTDTIVIRPVTVYGGYRIARVTTKYNGRTEQWDEDYEFLSITVYELERRCWEAIQEGNFTT